MSVPRRNGGRSTALAAVLVLLLLASHSDACGSSSSCPSKPPSPAPPPAPCSPGRRPAPAPKARGDAVASSRCPVNALKLSACASVLGGLVSLDLEGQQGQRPCCQLLGGLADLDAAVCLCTALRANVLGIVQLSAHVDLTALVNHCGKKLPQGFQCAPSN